MADPLSGLSPDQVRQILSLYSTGSQQQQLAQRRAELLERRGRQGKPYSTWGGAVAGGIGDVLGEVGDKLQQGRLDAQQQELLAKEQAGINAIAEARRGGGASPGAAAEYADVRPAAMLPMDSTPQVATAAEGMPPDASADVSPSVSLAPVQSAAPIRAAAQPRPSPGPAVRGSLVSDPITELQMAIRTAKGPDAFFADPQNAGLAPLFNSWQSAGDATLQPNPRADPLESRQRLDRAAELLRKALRRRGYGQR